MTTKASKGSTKSPKGSTSTLDTVFYRTRVLTLLGEGGGKVCNPLPFYEYGMCVYIYIYGRVGKTP